MIFSNVALGSLGVEDEKAIHVPGFRENIRGVAQWRRLDNHCFFYLEDVFITKEVRPPSVARQLAVKERIVIGAPTDLSDVEVRGDSQLLTHSDQVFSLNRFMLLAQPD